MNIVFVTTEFVSEGNFGGGLASYLNNISEILANLGHHITVITASDNDESIQWKDNILVERVYINEKSVKTPYHWKECLIFSYVLNKRLRNIIRRGDHIDIVQYTNFCGLALFRTKKPSVVRISSDMLLWRNANIEGFDLNKTYSCEKIGDYIEDIAVKKADSVYGPSKLLAGIIGQRTKRTIEVIESPLIQGNYKYDESTYEENLEGKTYLLTSSTLSRMKGAQTIAEGIYEILKKSSDLYYVLAGTDRPIQVSGEYISSVDYIMSKAGEYKDRVIYLGTLERGKLYPVIEHALAVILPSRIDNLPNSCIEAMYLKKVVIGTMNASYEQLIEDGENGFLIERDNSDSLVEAVNKVIHLTEEQRNEMGRRAKERTNQMNADIIAEKLIKFFHETLEQVNGSIRK